MDDVLAFRNSMAESGHEYTPAQAAGVIQATEKFRQQIHDGCRKNPEEYERLSNLTFEQKQYLCRQFADEGQEVTLGELEELLELVLKVYEDERMF